MSDASLFGVGSLEALAAAAVPGQVLLDGMARSNRLSSLPVPASPSARWVARLPAAVNAWTAASPVRALVPSVLSQPQVPVDGDAGCGVDVDLTPVP